MRPRKPKPAAAIAIVALVVALSGTAVAASHYIITSTSQIKPSVLRALRAGAKGTTALVGAQGPAGTQGPPGPTGAQGPPETARAYALVEPPCSGCFEEKFPANFTPLIAAHSKDVSLASPNAFYGKPAGTWCFILEGGIDPPSATVVASIVVDEESTTSSAVSVEWVPDAPDCSSNQIEIRTVAYAIENGKVIAERGIAVPFSFVVP